jgi:hypothetical protein
VFTLTGSSLVSATAYEDLPPSDGTYYNRVTTVSAVDNESALSDEASAKSDRTPPHFYVSDHPNLLVQELG